MNITKFVAASSIMIAIMNLAIYEIIYAVNTEYQSSEYVTSWSKQCEYCSVASIATAMKCNEKTINT